MDDADLLRNHAMINIFAGWGTRISNQFADKSLKPLR